MFNQGTSGKNFQGKDGKSFKVERQEELGLNLDMTKFRMYDYALGRFTSIDPLADTNPQESWTPYQYAYNSPIQYNDPYGDCPPWVCGAILGAVVDYGMQVAGNMAKGKSFTESLTSDISLSSIVTAAGEGAVTAGGSVMRRVIASGAKTIIDNTVNVKTNSEGNGVETTVETNPGNVVKNTVIDMGTDAIINEVVPTKLIKNALSKAGVNGGDVTKTLKKNKKVVTREANNKAKANAKKIVKATNSTVNGAVEKTVKLVTNPKKEEIKQKTDN